MDKTCKYYKYQKYVSYDSGQTWNPLQEFQRGGLMEFNSPDCGSSADEIYKWNLMDVSTNYYCDECLENSCIEPSREYIEAWTLLDFNDCINDNYICCGTTKYYKEIKQISYDSGASWVTPYPIEIRNSNIIAEYFSKDCGFEPSYRWYQVPITEDYVCSGDTMHYKEYCQISNDGERTWKDVIPTSSRTGVMYSDCAADCGCGTTNLFRAKYNNSGKYEYFVLCNSGDTNLTKDITRGYSKPYTEMTEADIGNCATGIGYGAFLGCGSITSCTIGSGVTSIGEAAFSDCTSLTSIGIPSGVTSIGKNVFYRCSGLTSIVIPDSVTSIGMRAFESCYNLTSIDIPSGVTSIDYGAFNHCSGLTSIKVNAVNPPALDGLALHDTNNCPIYVPSQSVDTYKSTNGWLNYKDRIQPIQ